MAAIEVSLSSEDIERIADVLEERMQLKSEIQLFDVPETARRLNVSTDKVYNLIKAGELTALELGRELRISNEELLRFVRSGGKKQTVGMTKADRIRLFERQEA